MIVLNNKCTNRLVEIMATLIIDTHGLTPVALGDKGRP